MQIKFSIVANPVCKNIERKLEKIYQQQDLPGPEEKPQRDCLPNFAVAFYIFAGLETNQQLFTLHD